jgi:uncharacterized repeat protein (TIGR01451 family)
VNTATVTLPPGFTDPTPGDLTASDSDSLTPSADLAITIAHSPSGNVTRGSNITYTVTPSLAGPSRATAVQVQVTLPTGETFSSANGNGWSCSAAAQVVTCTRPDLEVGQGLGRAGAGAILFAWAAPDESVPHTQHRDAIREAIVRARLPPASFEILEEASLPRLRAVLESRRDIRVVHLLAHGRLVDNRSGLVLHGDGARPSVVVSGEELAAVLGPSASRVRLVVLAACGAGDRRVSAVRLGSVAGAIHEAGIEAVIASRFALGKRASVTFSRALYEGVVVECTSLERAFVRARQAVADEGDETLDWAALQLFGRSGDGEDTRPLVFAPFPGLRPFAAAERRFFFGRDAELADLGARVERGGLTVVSGASGSGKSSLVLGGLVPELIDKNWRTVVFRPSDERATPTAALEARLPAGDGRMVVVVDQLEELFTVVEPGERARFVARLVTLARSASVVVCLRADYLGRLGELIIDEAGHRFDAIANAPESGLRLSHLPPERYREVIEGPAAAAGITLDDGLAQRLVDAVAREPGGCRSCRSRCRCCGSAVGDASSPMRRTTRWTACAARSSRRRSACGRRPSASPSWQRRSAASSSSSSISAARPRSTRAAAWPRRSSCPIVPRRLISVERSSGSSRLGF